MLGGPITAHKKSGDEQRQQEVLVRSHRVWVGLEVGLHNGLASAIRKPFSLDM